MSPLPPPPPPAEFYLQPRTPQTPRMGDETMDAFQNLGPVMTPGRLADMQQGAGPSSHANIQTQDVKDIFYKLDAEQEAAQTTTVTTTTSTTTTNTQQDKDQEHDEDTIDVDDE